MKKILFTTSFIENRLYDYWGENTPKTILRLAWKRRASYGLRFLSYNIPGIEILEFPRWKQFEKKVKSGCYDVIGFSFYIEEIPKVLKMVEFARENGVKEIWAGNYGALTPEIKDKFDKVFTGYGEDELSQELGVKIKKIRHPPIIVHSGMPIGLQFVKLGILQTTRGCPVGCKFCQTPAFSPCPIAVPLESIEEVLVEYKKRKVKEILIIDENFGIIPKHAEKVIEKIQKHGFFWNPMTRADILDTNFRSWVSKGLSGALIGIESFSQDNLDFVEKKESVSKIKELVKKINDLNLFLIGYYVIGFETDTSESIRRDMRALKKMNLDMYQICVITPFPKTPLWNHVKNKYGIFERNFGKFDTKHLVWNHPNIKPKEMEKILSECFCAVYSPMTFFKTIRKFYKKYTAPCFFKGFTHLAKSIIEANVSYHLKREYRELGDK